MMQNQSGEEMNTKTGKATEETEIQVESTEGAADEAIHSIDDRDATEIDSPKDGDEVAVESDENESDDEYAEHRNELPDYDHESNETLIKSAKAWAHHDDFHVAQPHLEAIRIALLKRLDEERDEVKARFLEQEGNTEIDFHFDQPLRTQFRDLYNEFKQRRRKMHEELDARLQANLNLKRTLIEELKGLPESEGSAPEKYRRFRELQDRWREIGHVPRSESRDLYNNYHFHVEQFYEFLKISNELREMDFRKNLETKEELIRKAEALVNEPTNHNTFDELQKLHRQWKEVGPVERDIRDAIWDRFSVASKAINDKRHAFYADLKKSHEERLQKKIEYVEMLERLDFSPFKTHKDWQTAIAQVNEWREAFKALGRIPLSANDEVWERYNTANRRFNQTKNQFYKEQKAVQKENLEKRKALVLRAVDLQESTDWGSTARELKDLQQRWKEIGFVPRAEGEKLWNQFREACNTFFNRMKENRKENEKNLLVHFEAKQALLAQVEAFAPAKGEKSIDQLKEYISKWKSIGSVPSDKRDIETRFNELLDKHFNTLRLDKKESAMIRFENRIHSLAREDGSIAREKETLNRKKADLLKELQQLENNMGFFKHSDPKNPLVREAQKNIDRYKEQIELLSDKIRALKKAGQPQDEKPAGAEEE